MRNLLLSLLPWSLLLGGAGCDAGTGQRPDASSTDSRTPRPVDSRPVSSSPTAPASLVVITLDTTRWDMLGISGSPLAETPFLDAWARGGTVFTDASTAAPVTLPAHCSLFTGLYPTRHGVHDNNSYRLPDRVRTLAEVLREAGYQTAAVVGAAVLDRASGIDQGFDVFDDLTGGGSLLQIAERSAREVTERAQQVLQRLQPDRPYFLWVHFFDPHAPYQPPDAFRVAWKQRIRQEPRLREEPMDRILYRAEIEYVDSQLSHLLGPLGQLPSPPLVVLAADHGESLGEHREATHGTFLYQSTMHVPLVIHHASLPARRLSQPVSLVDVLPTLLDLLDQPPLPTQGVSLAPLLRGQASADALEGRDLFLETRRSYHEFGWCWLEGIRRGPLKFIEAPRPELYDLERDPAELQDLLRGNRGKAQQWTLALRELAAGDAITEAEARSTARDDEVLLAALGYLSTRTGAPAHRSGLPDPKDLVYLIELRDQALSYLAAGRFDRARSQIERLLDENPDPMVGSVLMALCVSYEAELAGAGEAGEALRTRCVDWWRRVVERDPENLLFRHNLAMAHLRRGDHDAGLAELERCLRINPTDAETLLQLGQEFAQRGESRRAREYLEQARTAFASSERATYANELLQSLPDEE